VDVRPALADIEVVNYPSDHTTTFENVYTSAGRHQTLHAVAERLMPDRFRRPRRLTSFISHRSLKKSIWAGSIVFLARWWV